MVGFKMLSCSSDSTCLLSATFTSQLEKAFISSFFPTYNNLPSTALFDVIVGVGQYLKSTNKIKTLVSVMSTSRRYHEAMKGMVYGEIIIPVDLNVRSLGRIGMVYKKIIKSILVRDPNTTPIIYNLGPPLSPRKDSNYTIHLLSFVAGCYNLRNLDLQTILINFKHWPVKLVSRLYSLTTLVYKLDAFAGFENEIFDWRIPFPNLKHVVFIWSGRAYWQDELSKLNLTHPTPAQIIALSNRPSVESSPAFVGEGITHSLILEDMSLTKAVTEQFRLVLRLSAVDALNVIIIPLSGFQARLEGQTFWQSILNVHSKTSAYFTWVGGCDWYGDDRICVPTRQQYFDWMSDFQWSGYWESFIGATDEYLEQEESWTRDEFMKLVDFRASICWYPDPLVVERTVYRGAPALSTLTGERMDDNGEMMATYDIPAGQSEVWEEGMTAIKRMEVMMDYRYWDRKAVADSQIR